MNNIKTLLFGTALAATGVLSIRSTATASWAAGPCSDHPAPPRACIETRVGSGPWYHETDTGWQGSFPFQGEVLLNCPVAGISNLLCQVRLEGDVRLNGSPATSVSVRAVDSSVSQLPPPNDNPQCDNIDMAGFPWYIDSGHTFTDSGSVALSGTPLTGNFGAIDFVVGSFPISGHIHDLTFNNATNTSGVFDPSYFGFDSAIYVRPLGFDVSTGCTLAGNLYATDDYDINIFY